MTKKAGVLRVCRSCSRPIYLSSKSGEWLHAANRLRECLVTPPRATPKED